VLTGRAGDLAAHYATVGGTAPPEYAWRAARRVLESHTAEVRKLTGLPCQTNEVGQAVPLLIGLVEVARRTGAAVQLLEIGASAGLNLLLDRIRFGSRWGPPDSPCRLPDPGVQPDASGSRRGRAATPRRSIRPTRRHGCACRPACGATRWTGSSG
jgi:hypothetical protein